MANAKKTVYVILSLNNGYLRTFKFGYDDFENAFSVIKDYIYEKYNQDEYFINIYSDSILVQKKYTCEEIENIMIKEISYYDNTIK